MMTAPPLLGAHPGPQGVRARGGREVALGTVLHLSALLGHKSCFWIH